VPGVVVSDEKRFARVEPHRATQGAFPPDEDCVVFGWQVVGWEPFDGVFYMLKEDAEFVAAHINAAVEAERRKAAADAIRKAADWMNGNYGSNGEPPLDVNAAVAWLHDRADAVEKGET
jgi:hypothetical protein